MLSTRHMRRFFSSGTQKVVKCVEGQATLVEEPIPPLAPGHVTVKTAYSTLNYSDFFQLQVMREGQRLGLEGSGTIVDVADDVDKSFVGKKIGFFTHGWGTHTQVPLKFNMILPDRTDLRVAASPCINTLAACTQVHIAKQHQSKYFIQTAGASANAKMVYKFAKQEGLESIGVVRREDQIESLKRELGQEHVLNLTSGTFIKELRQVIKQTKPTVLFECFGGDVSGQIFSRMPPKSIMYITGNLSYKDLILNSAEMIYTEKRVEGFMLQSWHTQYYTPEEKAHYENLVANDLADGGKIFGSKFAKEVPLKDFQQGLEEFRKIASNGKTILNCQD